MSKTGTTFMLCGDMGIVATPGRDGKIQAYAFAGAVERNTRMNDRWGNFWVSKKGEIIGKVSDLVYKHLDEQHNVAILP
jgi:beta-lactamase class A